MRRPVRAAPAVALAAVVLAGGLAGCGSSETEQSEEQKMATVSGNCALEGDEYQLSPLSADVLEKTLGGGTYRLSGAVPSATPRSGFCRYVSVGEDGKVSQRLELSVNYKGGPDSPYAANQERLASDPDVTKIEGGKGYVQTTSASAYGGGDGEAGSAVLFDGDTVVSATIVSPGKGIDGATACRTLVTAAAKALTGPLPTK